MHDKRKPHDQDLPPADAAAGAGVREDETVAPEDHETAAGAPEPLPEPTGEERLAVERDDLKDKWLRALADLDNLRKRSRREVEDARRFAQAEVLRPLLDVADNLERALQALDGPAETTAAGLRQGVDLIHQSFRTALRERGVESIEAKGCHFDPARHEAVAQVPSPEHESGTVIDVVQQGYVLGELVLRPARVVIAS